MAAAVPAATPLLELIALELLLLQYDGQLNLASAQPFCESRTDNGLFRAVHRDAMLNFRVPAGQDRSFRE
jgi:hypothetical protein